jgi:hypothetical protein
MQRVREYKSLAVLVENPQGKRSLEGPRHRWEDSIKIDFERTWRKWMD